MIKKEEIEKLIQSGFDLELISFEFDIPIEQLIKCKNNLELAKSKRNSKKESEKKDKQLVLRFKIIKEKYKALYHTKNIESESAKELSEKEIEKINESIEKLEDAIKRMEGLTRREKRPIANEILAEMKKLEKYQWPLEEALKIYMLIHSNELKGLGVDITDRVDYLMNMHISKSESQLVKAFDTEINKVNDIESLQKLDRMLSIRMISDTPMLGTTRSKVFSKIMNLRRQMIMDSIRNNVSPELDSVVTSLTNGNAELSSLNKIIDEEVSKRIEARKNDKVTLTEEKERNQVLIQIRILISEKADKYPVKNPEELVVQINELGGVKLEEAVSTVVSNMIARKEFSEARDLCDKYAERVTYGKSEYSESDYTKYLRNLRNRVRNEEIGDFALRILESEESEDEAISSFKLLEKGLQKSKIPLRAIKLGKSLDGLRNITLADIWPPRTLESEER